LAASGFSPATGAAAAEWWSSLGVTERDAAIHERIRYSESHEVVSERVTIYGGIVLEAK